MSCLEQREKPLRGLSRTKEVVNMLDELTNDGCLGDRIDDSASEEDEDEDIFKLPGSHPIM